MDLGTEPPHVKFSLAFETSLFNQYKSLPLPARRQSAMIDAMQTTVEHRLTATSVIIIRSPRYYGHFFWPRGKTAIHFLVEKKKPSLIRSPVNMAKLFWPIGDRIKESPLYPLTVM